MKILQINNFLEKYGGSETVYLNTIELLKQNGNEVLSLSLLPKNGVDVNVSNYFVDIKSLYHSKFYSIAAKKKIEHLIKIEKPQIAHIHNIFSGVTFSIISTLIKNHIPIVITIHDFRLLCPVFIFYNKQSQICEKCNGGKYYNCLINNCSPFGIVRSALVMFESYFRQWFIPFEKRIDRFIFVSDFTMNKFFEKYSSLKNKSSQLYNFTFNFNFEENKTEKKYFLFVGRLSREKGLLTLIRAFKELPDLKLLIVGEGPLKKDILLEAPPNVELLGFKEGEELRLLIKNAYFVLVTSECYENNPMVIVESFAMGTPVIGSNIGGIPEIIHDGSVGFLFEPGNVYGLVRILTNTLEISTKDYFIISTNAFNFAKQHFNASSHYNKLIKIYNSAILNNKNNDPI